MMGDLFSILMAVSAGSLLILSFLWIGSHARKAELAAEDQPVMIWRRPAKPLTEEEVKEALQGLGTDHPAVKALNFMMDSTIEAVTDTLMGGGNMSVEEMRWRSGQLYILDELQKEFNRCVKGE